MSSVIDDAKRFRAWIVRGLEIREKYRTPAEQPMIARRGKRHRLRPPVTGELLQKKANAA